MTIDRRTFLGLAASVAAGAALSSCASVAALPVVPSNGAVRLPLAPHPALLEPGGFLRLGLPDGAGMIYVLALGAGEYAALSPICTHRGCTVGVAGAHLICPCHGSTYDRSGQVLRGPAERALRRFPAVVTPEGELVIQVAGR
jgi:cytochrome b6-f complex iron-sulfur subunit